jgi:hypothetical protein
MQLNLAFLDPPEPPSGRAPRSLPPAAWEQIDEAARIAALGTTACMATLEIRLANTKEPGQYTLARAKDAGGLLQPDEHDRN